MTKSLARLLCLLVLAAFPRSAPAGEIRKLAGVHLTLYTDVASDPAVDELPAVFDLAFPQWCEYFGVDPKAHADWRTTACLMKSKQPFLAAGLMPADLPEFPSRGYTASAGDRFWLYDQESPYYRRHLMLHEGTHAFMFSLLGGAGPPWHTEGIAELMATHRWRDGRLTLRWFPTSAAAVPGLGRIEAIQKNVAAGHGLRIGEVMAIDMRAYSQKTVESYAWSWAAAAFLDGHPRYHERFHKMLAKVNDANFNHELAQAFGHDGAKLSEEFQIFTADMAYGYDFIRTQLDFTPGKPLATGGEKVTVDAARGWQNSGLRLEAGASYRLRAKGRYQVAQRPRVLQSEPGGISIRYWHGKPLGELLAVVRPDESAAAGPSPFMTPEAIGTDGVLRPAATGTLFLRTNLSSGGLGDAAGSLAVQVSKN